MYRLICITDERAERSNALLSQACKRHDVDFRMVEPGTPIGGSLVRDMGAQMLYRALATKQAKTLEHMFLLHNEKVATFYQTFEHGFAKVDNVIEATMVHEFQGIPIPKTVYGLPSKEHLERVTEYLGGFPLIIKNAGGSHGIGVMKIDSLSSLRSVLDFLVSNHDPADFVLRAFIATPSSARLVVLGDRVIDSIEYRTPSGDFRSNLGASPRVHAKIFSKEIQDIAVRSVKVLGWEFGGVDILQDSQGRPYVTEVNLPCYFPRSQDCTGTDIALMMVEHLIKKAISAGCP